ncbi:SDR family oxidoreductase [Bordetella genomosp. 9]|uniref:SDR family oxidoreductase n=1 Tax=Bordetella genomosp. 9 TaxID=1416803 RepID=A0A1W6Z075_9BORD|nr:SDR family oxidoreductase [Bordetella genomosp. 9]ARP86767.1 SDR family oxidoreductase [Bordetella genomosp. 9]
MRLQGKTAWVTGSDSGIGRAVAGTFAREGADVLVHYRSDEQGARETAAAVTAAGRRAEVLQADFSRPENVTAFIEQARQRLGPPDILVNDAGMGASQSESLDTPLEEFLAILHVDVVAPWLLCQAVARDMIASGGGAIVNITSVHEEISLPGSAAYDAAKAALRSVTRTLALELAGKGVRINNVAPGMISTPMTQARLSDPAQAQASARQIPMGRPGQPQEVANVVLFLASDEAAYVTGSSYFVDGGLVRNLGGT